MAPNIGSIVLYCDQFDADDSQSPNVSPALVVKVNPDETLCLQVFFINGSFTKLNVKRGEPTERRTWHLIPSCL